mgnify:FL=1
MPYMVIPLGALFDWLNSRRVLRALCVVMLALWFINVQVPGMLIHCATSNKIGFYDPELIYIPRYTPLTFNLLRTATLARDWGRLLLDQAPPEAERYQGAPGEEYYRWLLFSPHRPEVPPFPSSQGPGPTC